MPKLLFFSGLFGFFFSLHSSRNKFKAHSNKTTTTIYDVDFVDLLPSPGVTVKSSSGAIKIVQATIHTHTAAYTAAHKYRCVCVFSYSTAFTFSRGICAKEIAINYGSTEREANFYGFRICAISHLSSLMSAPSALAGKARKASQGQTKGNQSTLFCSH